MERHVWTDERLDDMVARHNSSFDALHTELHEFRAEMREFRAEIGTRFDRMDDRFERLRGQMFQAVLILSGAMVATMVTILAKTL